MFHSAVLMLILVSVNQAVLFPLDEDICEENNYNSNLECFDVDEFGLYEDACQISKLYRRDIPNYKELEDNVKTPEEEIEESNYHTYPGKTKHHKNKNTLDHHKEKKHHYMKKHHKCTNEKSYRLSPFESYFKSAPQYRLSELNAQSAESAENVQEKKSKPSNNRTVEDIIKEEIIDRPASCEEVHVDKVIEDQCQEMENEEKVEEKKGIVVEENQNKTETVTKENFIQNCTEKTVNENKEKVTTENITVKEESTTSK